MGTYSYPIKNYFLFVVHYGPDQRKTIRPVQIEISAMGIPLCSNSCSPESRYM